MMQTEVLDVTGMSSDDCTETVMRAIKTIDGVGTVAVSYPASRAIVRFDGELTAPREMAAVLAKAGYGVRKLNLGEASNDGCSGRCGQCGCAE